MGIGYANPDVFISIHALVKRATITSEYQDVTQCNFNPRPREEGDAVKQFDKYQLYISIHALVKRATKVIAFFHLCDFISIHALVKRATIVANGNYPKEVISIHALVKRATPQQIVQELLNSDFNPRPREEGDVSGKPLPFRNKLFQSTPS